MMNWRRWNWLFFLTGGGSLIIIVSESQLASKLWSLSYVPEVRWGKGVHPSPALQQIHFCNIFNKTENQDHTVCIIITSLLFSQVQRRHKKDVFVVFLIVVADSLFVRTGLTGSAAGTRSGGEALPAAIFSEKIWCWCYSFNVLMLFTKVLYNPQSAI